jgi:hypothetical protein
MQQSFILWPTRIEVIDNFIEDVNIINQLKEESIIKTVISGQDTSNMSWAQSELMGMVDRSVMTYCAESNIDYNSLALNDMQKGCLYPYSESMVGNHLYEPHHDIAENGFITAIYYINSDWTEETWVGGELCIYKQLTFSDYPENSINILPKSITPLLLSFGSALPPSNATGATDAEGLELASPATCIALTVVAASCVI